MTSSTVSSNAGRVVFTGKQQVKFESFEVSQPGEGQVRVKTQLTLMSTGTENIVFNRLFDAGTGWDNWVKYPFYPGYTAVGIVEAIGTGVKSVKVGDKVASRYSHRSHEVLAESSVIPIPESLPFEEAVWFALAKIAFHGALVAEYELGDSVLIIGAGPIGQMSVRWANAAGASSIIVVDPLQSRLDLAKAGGATAVLSVSIKDAKDQILAANGGKLPRVVIDSTGNAAVFEAALGLAEKFGRVVILGDTGTPSQQHLTGDVIGRGLTVVGAHDTHNNEKWNNYTISSYFFKLAASGRFNLKNLNTHTFNPEKSEDAYGTANRDRASTMGILFDWRKF